MRQELHFAENMHFVWEAVKLFENTFYVVHTHLSKREDYNAHMLSLNNVCITCKIVPHLNVWAVIYTSQSLKQRTCFPCLNVGNDLNFALK